MTDEIFSLAEKEAKEKLRQAVRRLNACYKEQNELTKQIADLRSVIAAFARMRNEEFIEEDEFGMTDAIRLALVHSGLGMTPEEVKKAIYEIGFDTDNYENVMAAIGTALKRLVEQNQVSMTPAMKIGDVKTRYQWAGGQLVALKSLMGIGFKKKKEGGMPPPPAATLEDIPSGEKPPLSGYYRPKK
jgi:hypothetical protein